MVSSTVGAIIPLLSGTTMPRTAISELSRAVAAAVEKLQRTAYLAAVADHAGQIGDDILNRHFHRFRLIWIHQPGNCRRRSGSCRYGTATKSGEIARMDLNVDVQQMTDRYGPQQFFMALL